ncbi:MAG: hypothetical protein U0694_21365 [Anaerolineae bacterium]
MWKWGVVVAILVAALFGLITNGLVGLVSVFLIGSAGGIVGIVMYFGREPEHQEHASDQS